MSAAAKPRTRLWSSIKAWVAGPFRLSDPEPWATHFGDGSGISVNPKSAMQLDAVWSCVRIIAETISTLPLSMFERTGKGKQVAGDHQLHFIIHDQPNADSTAAVFWEAMVASMLLRGAGRAEKLMLGNRLVGLRFLNPDCLRKVTLPGGRKVWRYTKDGKQRDIPKDRVWTIPGFTLDGENGVSVISYGAKVFGAAIAAEQAARSTFKNGLLQTVYYKIGQFLTPGQRTEFKKNVYGSIERGEMPLLEGGTSAETLGIKPGDAQLLESRSFSVEAICRWFRVDPSLVGHGSKDSNWGTGLEQKMIWFLTFTLGPWLRRIEQAISKDLLTTAERQRYYPKFSVEGLLRADSTARAAFYAAMVNNGILTRDEVRELEDRPPMGGNAAVLTVQSAMTTLDSVGSSDDAQAVRASLRALLGLDDNPAPRD